MSELTEERIREIIREEIAIWQAKRFCCNALLHLLQYPYWRRKMLSKMRLWVRGEICGKQSSSQAFCGRYLYWLFGYFTTSRKVPC